MLDRMSRTAELRNIRAARRSRLNRPDGGRSHPLHIRHDIVAVALLTREDVARVGNTLKLVFKVDDTPRFEELLRALDRPAQAGSGSHHAS